MKNPPRLLPLKLLALLLGVGVLGSASALTPTEWAQRQTLPVTSPGLTKVLLPVDTFDAAQPGLSDLRVLDPDGQEVPYLIDRAVLERGATRPPAIRPASFRSRTQDNATQLLIATGTTDPLESLTLETAAPFFLHAAHVDLSANGTDWESLGAATPLFRQFDAENLRLSLGRRPAAFIRITLDDLRARTVNFTGVQLQTAPTRTEPPALLPLGATITRRDEFAGETVLTLTLDGRQLPLAALVFDTPAALFMRRVTVAIREARGATSTERVVASGTIYRVALDGAPARSQLDLPLEFIPPSRELLVHIHHGDSPPLALTSVQARYYPVHLLFHAPTRGPYTLLAGNAQVQTPRYDLAAFAGEMRAASATLAVPGALTAMPDYRPRDTLAESPLPDVSLTGAPLDTASWRSHQAVLVTKPGVQELELDLTALARSRNDFADLRVMRAGQQIPYVLEQPTLARALALTAMAAPDAKRPRVSVWQVRLPQTGLPLQRMVLTTATPLFQRQFRLYEKVTTPEGRAMEVTLASGDWSRTPQPGSPETHTLVLSGRLRSDTVWIETDNGDNPAIELGPVQALYPVVRLIFKVAETDGFTLAYDHPAASAPRYDLSLVATKLLTAPRQSASLAPTAVTTDGKFSFAQVNGGYVFWAALALVVLVLLTVVAKLLPKPPSA